jgi:hypothetical protein
MTPEEKAKLAELKAKEEAEADLTPEERAELIAEFRERKATKAKAKEEEETKKKKRSFL